MKIDFTKLTVEVSYEGETKEVNVAKEFANCVKMSTTDIGLEEFCKEIYFSKEAVEIPEEYRRPLINYLNSPECPIFAFVKKEIIKQLNKE